MHISRVVYQRVKSVEVEVALNEDDNADQAFRAAKKYVNGKLDLGPTQQEVRDAYATLRDAGMVEDPDMDEDFDPDGPGV
jgi:hypothetical protein